MIVLAVRYSTEYSSRKQLDWHSPNADNSLLTIKNSGSNVAKI